MNVSNPENFIQKTFSYDAYRKMLDAAVADVDNPTELQLKIKPYIERNIAIMDYWENAAALSPVFEERIAAGLSGIMVVFTEGWCGDAAHILPFLNKISMQSREKIRLRLLLRDENEEIMNAYLTNGSKSIPKLIYLNDTLQEKATWGPRPVPLENLVPEWKKEGGDVKILTGKINEWYKADKGISILEELERVLQF